MPSKTSKKRKQRKGKVTYLFVLENGKTHRTSERDADDFRADYVDSIQDEIKFESVKECDDYVKSLKTISTDELSDVKDNNFETPEKMVVSPQAKESLERVRKNIVANRKTSRITLSYRLTKTSMAVVVVLHHYDSGGKEFWLTKPNHFATTMKNYVEVFEEADPVVQSALTNFEIGRMRDNSGPPDKIKQTKREKKMETMWKRLVTMNMWLIRILFCRRKF